MITFVVPQKPRSHRKRKEPWYRAGLNARCRIATSHHDGDRDFPYSLYPFMQVTRRWLNFEGMAVAAHVADQVRGGEWGEGGEGEERKVEEGMVSHAERRYLACRCGGLFYLAPL